MSIQIDSAWLKIGLICSQNPLPAYMPLFKFTVFEKWNSNQKHVVIGDKQASFFTKNILINSLKSVINGILNKKGAMCNGGLVLMNLNDIEYYQILLCFHSWTNLTMQISLMVWQTDAATLHLDTLKFWTITHCSKFRQTFLTLVWHDFLKPKDLYFHVDQNLEI